MYIGKHIKPGTTCQCRLERDGDRTCTVLGFNTETCVYTIRRKDYLMNVTANDLWDVPSDAWVDTQTPGVQTVGGHDMGGLINAIRDMVNSIHRGHLGPQGTDTIGYLLHNALRAVASAAKAQEELTMAQRRRQL